MADAIQNRKNPADIFLPNIMIQQHDCHKAQRKWFLRIKVLLKEGKNLFRIVLGDFQRGAEAVTDRPIIDLRQKGFRIGKNLFQPHPRIRMRVSDQESLQHDFLKIPVSAAFICLFPVFPGQLLRQPAQLRQPYAENVPGARKQGCRKFPVIGLCHGNQKSGQFIFLPGNILHRLFPLSHNDRRSSGCLVLLCPKPASGWPQGFR